MYSPGEKNLKVLENVMRKLNIEKTSNISTKNNGLFYSMEIETNQLNFIDVSILKKVPKCFRDEALKKILAFHPDLIDEIEIPHKYTESLRYDFVVYKVENNKVSFIKTFELQGEGHYDPVFGVDGFVKTVLSDVIKEHYGTRLIPFYKGIEKDIVLMKEIKRACI